MIFLNEEIKHFAVHLTPAILIYFGDRSGELWFEVSPGKKLARPHFN
jgi:hypothetical protein